jgi:hypothetical protein
MWNGHGFLLSAFVVRADKKLVGAVTLHLKKRSARPDSCSFRSRHQICFLQGMFIRYMRCCVKNGPGRARVFEFVKVRSGIRGYQLAADGVVDNFGREQEMGV